MRWKLRLARLNSAHGADSAENRTAGILWMLATMFCFISLDAIMKHLMESYSLVQVTWARFFFATIVAAWPAGRALAHAGDQPPSQAAAYCARCC